MATAAELESVLVTAKMLLTVLEQQASGYTSLTIPAPLKLQLDEKRQEVASLETRLAQLQGRQTATLPDNLPRYNSIFVGHQDEIARCLEALAPEAQGWGVTLDGSGGSGKTALALEVADRARQQDPFDAYLFAVAKTTRLSPDGVRQETLALSSLDAFCREFARLLGETNVARISDATARRRALLDALRGRRALLIWDNLETLTAEEQNQIAEFLRKLPAPNKAIITSRLTDESALTLHLDKLTLTDATALMHQIGQRQPQVAQELHQAGQTGQQALYDAADGNPLALDWTLGLIAQKGYSFATALARLQDGVRSSDLYRFLFAVAVDGLVAIDRFLLAALSVFFSPATLAALSDITEQPATVVRSSLERLVTLSLVKDLAGDRYSLHPLTRTYITAALRGPASPSPVSPISNPSTTRSNAIASLQLDAAAQRQALRYWLDYAQKYGGQGKDAYQTFDQLEAEWPTLESAARSLWEQSGLPDSLQDQKAAQLLIDLQRALSNFLDFRGYWDEGLCLGQWCYQAGQALKQWRNAGWAAYEVAWIHYLRGETDQAATWAERMAAAMEQGGRQRDRAEATRMQGLIAVQRQDWARAEQQYQDALATYQDLGLEQEEAIVLQNLGMVARQQEQYDRAEDCYQQALAIAEKLNMREPQAYISGNLGRLALNRQRPQAARPWFERELALAQEIGRQDQIASAQSGLAQVLEAEGRDAEALALAQQALQIRQRLQDRDLAFSQQLVARLQQRLAL